MARETKVGLIVGLGVILFVSVFVSDYLSVPESAEALSDVPTPNYVANTTNQPEFTLIREEDGETTEANLDPGNFAAVSLESHEEAYGRPEPVGTPPFREASRPLADPVEDTTPLADTRELRTGTPIGEATIDDPRLATINQLDTTRPGPGLDTTDNLRVEIPEPILRETQPTSIKHTVAAGENLTAIARKYYDGDGNLWRSIRDANPGKVGTNGEIVQGVVLTIPKRSVQTDDPAGTLAERGTGSGDRPERQRVRMVTVKEGETLSELASEHLGSARKWQLIMDVNTDILEKPEHLRAGMKLRIPAEPVVELIEEANEALATGPSEEAAHSPERGTANTYTVKEGDNLYKIAKKLLGDGERYDDIYQANKDKLSSADAIRVGMKLKMPNR